MARPKKITTTRSGVLGDNDKPKRKTKEPINPNVRVKAPRKRKTPTVQQEVGIRLDAEAENETACSLFLHLNANSGIVEIAHEIPAKTLSVKLTRIHFKTLVASQTYPAVGIVLNIISPVQVNSNLSMAPIPIISNYSGVDVACVPNVQLTIGKNIPKRIEYRIVDLTTNELVPSTALDFCQLWIGYTIYTS